MTIEKTYKLSIKDQSFFLSEEEVTKLYEQCRMVLNINDLPTTNTVKPNIPYPYDTYPWYTPKYPNDTGTPYWTSPTTTTNTTGINFIKDDMTTIKDNTIKDSNNWRSSVQKSLDKLNAKTNVNWHSSVAQAINKLNAGSKKDNTTTTSEGIKVG